MSREPIEHAQRQLWLRVFGVWLLCALLLSLLCSLFIAQSSGSSRQLGYAGSAVSFISAAAAAGYLVRQGKGRSLLAGLLVGLGLCVLLLLAGCLIDARHLSPDAVLSIVSFTFSGSLVGSLLRARQPGRRKKGTPRFRRAGKR